MPELTHTGQRLYDALAPLAEGDEENGWALAHFCAALATQLDAVADMSRDSEDGTPGWSQIMDPLTVPAAMIPWLAQMVGVSIPDGLADDLARERIVQTDGFRRGTPQAMIGAALPHLTGNKAVYLIERHGSPYVLTLSTWADETPDPAALERAVREQKPGGLILHVETIEGGTFDTLRDTHTDFDDVQSEFDTFNDLRADPART